jgi:hypothetical protein
LHRKNLGLSQIGNKKGSLVSKETRRKRSEIMIGNKVQKGISAYKNKKADVSVETKILNHMFNESIPKETL